MPEGIKRGHTDRQIDRKVGRDGERKKERNRSYKLYR